ncbi:hypothetical protein [Kordiimonas sp.]
MTFKDMFNSKTGRKKDQTAPHKDATPAADIKATTADTPVVAKSK